LLVLLVLVLDLGELDVEVLILGLEVVEFRREPVDPFVEVLLALVLELLHLVGVVLLVAGELLGPLGLLALAVL
jgi:hypothetical protein